jgi:hypothetical protein
VSASDCCHQAAEAASVSTFGRDQDQLAARRRDYTRLNAEKAIKLQDAVRFVISVWKIERCGALPPAILRSTRFA